MGALLWENYYGRITMGELLWENCYGEITMGKITIGILLWGGLLWPFVVTVRVPSIHCNWYCIHCKISPLVELSECGLVVLPSFFWVVVVFVGIKR